MTVLAYWLSSKSARLYLGCDPLQAVAIGEHAPFAIRMSRRIAIFSQYSQDSISLSLKIYMPIHRRRSRHSIAQTYKPHHRLFIRLLLLDFVREPTEHTRHFGSAFSPSPLSQLRRRKCPSYGRGSTEWFLVPAILTVPRSLFLEVRRDQSHKYPTVTSSGSAMRRVITIIIGRRRMLRENPSVATTTILP